MKLAFILLIFDFYELVYYLKNNFFIEIIINTLASIVVYGIILIFKKTTLSRYKKK